MKIVIATPLYPPDLGGPAKYAKSLHEEFLRLGHKAPVVAYGVTERTLPPGLRHAWYFLRLLWRMPLANAVLALDTWSVGAPALWASRLCGKKLLVRIGGDPLWESYVERTGELVKLSEFYSQPRDLSKKERYMRHVAERLGRYAVLAFTTTWQKGLWTRAYGLSAERTAIVENAYPARQPAVPWSNKVFVAAGRDIKLKNMSVLRQAFARVKERHPDIALDTDTLEPAAQAERLARCYAVVVPSISEVNPNTLAEAVAYGKPFVAPRDTGAGERLAGAGLFVDTTNIQALEEAIESLLKTEAYEQYAVAAGALPLVREWPEVARGYLALLSGGDNKSGPYAA